MNPEPGTAHDVEPLVTAFAREAVIAGASVHGPVSLDDVWALVQRLVRETGTAELLAWQPDALGAPDAWRRLEALGLTPLSPVVPADATSRLAALTALGDVAVGLTSAIGALADTGTLVVASGPGRPRLAWLLPSRHIAIVNTAVIQPDMDAFFRHHDAGAHEPSGTTEARPERGRPSGLLPAHLAFVTGPSRTADIELTLTRGVHGPREVHVILAADQWPPFGTVDRQQTRSRAH